MQLIAIKRPLARWYSELQAKTHEIFCSLPLSPQFASGYSGTKASSQILQQRKRTVRFMSCFSLEVPYLHLLCLIILSLFKQLPKSVI